MTNGPDWLGISGDGTLSGTPQNVDVGENVFKVTASNDGKSADLVWWVLFGGALPAR